MKRLFLVKAVLLICCAVQGAFANDTWTKPTSANDITGIWEGNLSIGISRNPLAMIPESSIKLDVTLDCREAASRTNASVHFTARMDFNKFMDDFTNQPEIRLFGVTKEVLWEMLVSEMKDENITYGKYYLIFTQSEYVDEFFLENSNEQILLNNDKTKMLLNIDFDLSMGFGNDDNSEIILTKRLH